MNGRDVEAGNGYGAIVIKPDDEPIACGTDVRVITGCYEVFSPSTRNNGETFERLRFKQTANIPNHPFILSHSTDTAKPTPEQNLRIDR